MTNRRRWEDQEYQRNPECSVSSAFLRAFQAGGRVFCHTALASISIPERVASSPAGELISRQNQTPTALVPRVELYKHGLWIYSSTNKASNLPPVSTFYVGHTLKPIYSLSLWWKECAKYFAAHPRWHKKSIWRQKRGGVDRSQNPLRLLLTRIYGHRPAHLLKTSGTIEGPPF